MIRALDLYERYNGITYRKAEGFDVVTVAVQSDKTAWKEDLAALKIEKLTNCAAVKGFNDMYLKSYKLGQLPVTFLIDETGYILAVDPTMKQIEDVLDSKKNSIPNPKDLSGKLLFTEGAQSPVKNQKAFLLNKFGDTLSRNTTDLTGAFTFRGIKVLNQFVIRIDTGGSLLGRSKVCLANAKGACFNTINKTDGYMDLKLFAAEINILAGIVENENPTKANYHSIDVPISFKKNGSELENSAFDELDKIATMMFKDKSYKLEIISHTDCRGDDEANLELSKKRSSAIKNYLVTKEITPARMKPVGKGETEPKNKCKNGVPCSETEHAENVRTEFRFYK